ncbi:MAG: sulfotransferase family protein [Proteobacteria bacterium]|nr:MAG: sulfotransferase family protein [Pseudomonadota bacterium]
MLNDNLLQKKFGILQNKFKAGLYEEVINEAKALLRKRQHQVLYNIICLSYQNLGKFKESIEIMEKALNINSKNIYFLNNIGVGYYKLEDYTKAQYYFIRVLSIEPNYITTLNNLGNLSRDLNNTEEAIKYYKKCLSINDKLEQPQYNLALCYESIGDLDEALKILKNILKINPDFTECDRIISTIVKYRENDEHFKSINEKISEKKLNDQQKMQLFFALGKYYEDIKDYEKSFLNYSSGNDIYKKLTGYNINDDKKYFYKIKKFDFEKIKNKKKSDYRKKLIFIIEMPRSGTSLAEQIISSHHNVFGGGELNFLPKIIDKNLLNNEEINNLTDHDFDKILSECRENYFQNVKLLDETEKSFTDKAPLNFRYIGFIKEIFPNAKVINCLRNSLDICWSNYKNYFSGGLYFSNNLNDLGEFFNMYNDLINFWEKCYPNYIYNLDHQNLTENPKEEIKKLLAHCELEWDENCLNHQNNTRSIKTVSSMQARKPIYKVKKRAVEPYLKYLGPLEKILNN